MLAFIAEFTLRNIKGIAFLVAILFGLLFYWSITSKNRNYHD